MNILHVSIQFRRVLTLLRWAFSGLLMDGGGEGGGAGCRKALFSKICHAYAAMMKLGTLIPYQEKIQKIYKSWDASINFC